MQFKLTIVLLCVSLGAHAQVADGELIENEPPRIMIIPFNDFYYLSDSDPELAKANQKRAEDVSTLFRYGITNNVASRVITSYDTYNILTDTTVQSKADLHRIYGSIQYKYQKPIDVSTANTDNKDLYTQDIFGMEVHAESAPAKKDKKAAAEEDENRKYMNAVVKDASLFSYLHQQYGASMFVFINQFEVKTKWENCLDLATQNFEREIMVHYSIYNVDGVQLKGDAVSVTFPSNENSFDQIMGEQFPLIADQLGMAVHETTVLEQIKK